jgi:DNA-binding transcriptional ArsR family regulator
MTEACDPHDHAPRADLPADPAQIAAAAALFRGMGDPGRLLVLHALLPGPACVSDLARALDLPLPALSQRLRVLREAGLVTGARDGRHVVYALSDDHVVQLVHNALAHAGEPHPPESP